jgi:hypothetical protein
MDHESLRRKLALLEGEILPAQSEALPGDALLPKVSLTLDVAIRVAANIRSRLAGVTRSADKPTYDTGNRSLATD